MKVVRQETNEHLNSRSYLYYLDTLNSNSDIIAVFQNLIRDGHKIDSIQIYEEHDHTYQYQPIEIGTVEELIRLAPKENYSDYDKIMFSSLVNDQKVVGQLCINEKLLILESLLKKNTNEEKPKIR